MGNKQLELIILVSHLKMWIHFNYIPSGLIYTSFSIINRNSERERKNNESENAKRKQTKKYKKNQLVSLSIELRYFDFDCAEIICNRFSFCLLYFEYTAETISSHFPNPFYLLFSFSAVSWPQKVITDNFFLFIFAFASIFLLLFGFIK